MARCSQYVLSTIDNRVQTITLDTPTEKKAARRTPAFRTWFDGLKDGRSKTIVAARVERVQMGLYGDVKPVGAGVSELRIDHGPGLRVYFTETLDRTIKQAQQMLGEFRQQRNAVIATVKGRAA